MLGQLLPRTTVSTADDTNHDDGNGEDKDEKAGKRQQPFADQKSDDEVEGDHRQVEHRAKKSSKGDVRSADRFFPFSTCACIDQLECKDHEKTHGPPAEIIGEGDPEVHPRLPVAVNLPKKPASALQGDRIDDDVEENLEQGAEEEDREEPPNGACFQ